MLRFVRIKVVIFVLCGFLATAKGGVVVAPAAQAAVLEAGTSVQHHQQDVSDVNCGASFSASFFLPVGHFCFVLCCASFVVQWKSPADEMNVLSATR